MPIYLEPIYLLTFPSSHFHAPARMPCTASCIQLHKPDFSWFTKSMAHLFSTLNLRTHHKTLYGFRCVVMRKYNWETLFKILIQVDIKCQWDSLNILRSVSFPPECFLFDYFLVFLLCLVFWYIFQYYFLYSLTRNCHTDDNMTNPIDILCIEFLDIGCFPFCIELNSTRNKWNGIVLTLTRFASDSWLCSISVFINV